MISILVLSLELFKLKQKCYDLKFAIKINKKDVYTMWNYNVGKGLVFIEIIRYFNFNKSYNLGFSNVEE